MCRFGQPKSSLKRLISLNLLNACATVDSPGKIFSFKGETISGLALLLFASPLTLLEQTSGVARVILGILLILSVFSWALILQKYSQLGGLDGKTSKFLQMFRAGRGLSDPNTLRAGVGRHSADIGICGGISRAQSRRSAARMCGRCGADRQAEKCERHRRRDAGSRRRRSAPRSRRECRRWRRSPRFRRSSDLFGTVWGVMDAFAGLGDAGAASLRAVAPGIAEALVTTAAGLFAAIPALIAYNHYLHGIRGHCLADERFRGGIRLENRDAVQLVALCHAKRRTRNRLVTFGNQYGAVHRRGAGAADHFHDYGADPAVGHRSGSCRRPRR